MWEVVQERDKYGTHYCVENQDTGETHGTHDCQKWAQAVADYLNKRDGYED